MPLPVAITWSVLTPRSPGAIAIIALHGDPARIDHALAALAVPTIPTGAARLATLRAPASDHVLDRAVIARFTPDLAHIMAHGGPLIVDAITTALELLAIPQLTPTAPEEALHNLYPEAADIHEARVVHALAHAASPRAVDLLLDQPRRWRAHETGSLPMVLPESARRLRHLLTPPLVVAVGPSNIGKSSLINALAGRDAAIVADEPGTTRDHVGVQLDLFGLVVRWLDTPGVRENPDLIEQQALDIALSVANSADLLLVCDDLADPSPVTPPRLNAFLDATHAPILRASLRADRAQRPSPPAQTVRVSILDRPSLDALARSVADALLGPAPADPGAWAFWCR